MDRTLKILFLSVLFVGLGSTVFGQLPGSVEKLAGQWNYYMGNGFEEWKMEGDELKGRAYRVSKMQDTSLVEELTIKKVNKNLIHILKTYNIVQDSTITTTYHFVGGKRKLKFINIDSNTPYSIQYKFGFLNRRKLIIKIKYGPNDKATKFKLFKPRVYF